MSDSVDIAQSIVTMQANATQQLLRTEMLRQQAQADQAVVALIQESTERMQAALPAGQGEAVDISA
ncbi:MAG: hypothetical protein DCF30_21080 [Hyphomicrobiales bacterium]|nr:MAG: hypothetical protein DCF30_21080 [Hyphomicrobiales bacterium]